MRGEVVDTIGLPGVPGLLIRDGDNLWIVLVDRRDIVRVDPVRRAVTATLPVGETAPMQLAVAGSDIWALAWDEMIRIDTAVTERLVVGQHSVAFPPQFTGPIRDGPGRRSLVRTT